MSDHWVYIVENQNQANRAKIEAAAMEEIADEAAKELERVEEAYHQIRSLVDSRIEARLEAIRRWEMKNGVVE